MTEEKLYQKLGYDWHELELYEIAHEFFSQGNEEGKHLAKKSLELLLKERDISGSDPISITLVDNQVIAKAIQNGLSVYREGYEDQTIEEIINYNQNVFNTYAGERAEEIKRELNPFYDKKYSDILKEIDNAKKIIGAKDVGHVSEEEAKTAKKNIEKYVKILNAINSLELKRKYELITKIRDDYDKETFNSSFPLEKIEERETA